MLLHGRYDVLCGMIVDLEREHGVIRNLLPDGEWRGQRKTWSYHGVLLDGRDFGNWGYAVVMRSLFKMGLVNYDMCNDILLGDVIEAIFHLGFNVYRHDAGLPFLKYAVLFNMACLTLESIEKRATSMGHWTCSRRFALLIM